MQMGGMMMGGGMGGMGGMGGAMGRGMGIYGGAMAGGGGMGSFGGQGGESHAPLAEPLVNPFHESHAAGVMPHPLLFT